jgi:hypothetical protein
MINIICLKDLSKWQKVESINLLIEREMRSPIQDVRLCSELAPLEYFDDFIRRCRDDDAWAQFLDLTVRLSKTDKCRKMIGWIKVWDSLGKDVNLIQYRDVDEQYNWRTCVKNFLEANGCIAEVR